MASSTGPVDKNPPCIAIREVDTLGQQVKVIQHAVSPNRFTEIATVVRYVGSGATHFIKNLVTLNWKNLIRPGIGRLEGRQLRLETTKSVVKNYSGNFGMGVSYGSGPEGDDLIVKVAAEVHEFLQQTSGQDLFEIPLNTFAEGREAHAVSLVIDRTNKKIYILDSKGCDLKKLYFYDPSTSMATDKTVREFLEALLSADSVDFYDNQDWEVQTTVWTQKPRDCVFTIEVMLQGLANQDPKKRSLDAVQCALNDNYENVDRLRAKHFASVAERALEEQQFEVEELDEMAADEEIQSPDEKLTALVEFLETLQSDTDQSSNLAKVKGSVERVQQQFSNPAVVKEQVLSEFADEINRVTDLDAEIKKQILEICGAESDDEEFEVL